MLIGWLHCLICCLLLSYVSTSYAYEVVDDLGHLIQLDKPASRIIALAPDITEILFAIGANKNIVGTVDSSDFPAAAKSITRVGSYSGLDMERIIALKPDLIITWGQTFSRQLTLLQTLHIPIYVTHPAQLEDVAKTMQRIGVLTDRTSASELAARHYLAQLAALQAQNQSLTPIKVFYQIGANALFTINKDSWINQAITLCGGKNIFANAKLIGAEVNMEAVIDHQPQIILSDVRQAQHWQMMWQHFAMIPAVKNRMLFTINPDWIDRAGPRLLLGVAAMCHDINQARTISRL